MKRLVYTPRVDAFIQTDNGVYDVSPYITRGNITRRINAVSTVNLTLRNPQFIWTDQERTDSDGTKVLAPVFHPMDKIVVTMTRIENRPIQVFTGFLDTAPYISAFPGTVELTASCTLKRLLYTYFDPGLPFFHEFLEARGWQSNREMGITNLPEAEDVQNPENYTLNDASFGQLLFDVLTELGGWDPETIYIERLPDGIPTLVAKMFTENKTLSKEAFRDLEQLLTDIIGTAELSGYAADGGAATAGPTSGGYHRPGTRLEKGKTYTVGASTYGWTPQDDNGVDVLGKSLFSGNPAVAELGGTFGMKISGGGADYNQKVRVCYKGRCTIAYFRDVGPGYGNDVKGKRREIDLHQRVAKKIGFPNGLDLVEITLL